MADLFDDAFDQLAFAASAAALVASHVMSDSVWKTYFPELPAKQPELRTVLINLHRCALAGEPPNLTEARQMVMNQFDVSQGTAIEWLDFLEGLGFLVRLSGSKKSSSCLVPSSEAKIGLFKVGQEYLVCLRLVSNQLRQAITSQTANEIDLEWLSDIKAALNADVQDYVTRSHKEKVGR